jgi:uncharacterized protein YqgC (DUF456 family)
MAKRISAYVCLAAGVAACFVPILPGIPLIVLGMKLLGAEHPIRRTLARWIPGKASKTEDHGAAVSVR